ncbi:MAG: hypothetical protein IIZ35_00045 [Clostridia bacterium]|nr:hypothetical protein [Clostridia bacterium]
MTILEALEAAVTSITSQTYDAEYTSDAITALVTALKEEITGAVELPAVTATDNGDILKVADGAWAKADAPADKSPLVIAGTVDNTTVTITTALADIKAAFDAGRMVFLVADNVRYTITACVEDDGQVGVTFDVTFYDTNDSAVVQMHVEFANVLTGTLTITALAAAQA